MKYKKITILLTSIIVVSLIISFTFFMLGAERRAEYPFKYDIPAEESSLDTFSQQITDINSLINKDIIGLIYFGRDTCTECLALNQILDLIAAETEDLVIYKFDTDFWRDDESFDAVLNMYSIDSVPSLVYVSEEKSIEHILHQGETYEDLYARIISLTGQ